MREPLPAAALSLLAIAMPITAQQATPIPVAVHEPLELLSIAARLAGYEEYQQHRTGPAYARAAAAHFAAGKDHPLVQRLRELRTSHSIAYDAVASLAVHLGPLPGLQPRTPWQPLPPRLDARWQGVELEPLVASLRDFAVATKAAEFFAANRVLYAEAERRLAARLADSKARPWFDTFFGARAGATYTAHIGLLCGGNNYGVGVRHTDGTPDELRPVFGCWRFDGDGVPEFGKELLPLFVHELCHSYTNPIVDRHRARLQAAGDRLFAAKATAMRRQAYADGYTVLCETFVRACVIRCVTDTDGEAAGKKQAAAERRDHFLWAGELAELLREYQTDRTRYPDFDAFVPRLAKALDDIAARLDVEAVVAPRLLTTSPAIGDENVDPSITQLVFTFDRAMRDQSWSVVGSRDDTPAVTGSPSYDAARKVLVVPVRLEPERSYRFALNSTDKQGFTSADGVPLAPVAITFRTRSEH